MPVERISTVLDGERLPGWGEVAPDVSGEDDVAWRNRRQPESVLSKVDAFTQFGRDRRCLVVEVEPGLVESIGVS